MLAEKPSFLYLNREGQWPEPEFHRHGLEVDEQGVLRLTALPRLEGAVPDGLAELPAPTGPAGMALMPDGALFFTEPGRHRLIRVNPCPPPEPEPSEPPDAESCCAPCGNTQRPETILTAYDPEACPEGTQCLGRYGNRPGQFNTPRGLLYHPRRGDLLVADSGNDRIQVLDGETFQVVGIWGGTGSHPGKLNRPWDLAVDSQGSVYVVDSGNRRVQKFDEHGVVQPGFWEQAQSTNRWFNADTYRPAAVTVYMDGDRETVAVLDRGAGRISLHDTDGKQLRFVESPAARGALGLTATSNAFYTSDGARMHVQVLRAEDGSLAGQAYGYNGPVAALALIAGSLMVNAGVNLIPFTFNLQGAYASRGYLFGGPFSNTSYRREDWHVLKAQVAALEPGAHFQLFVFPASSSAAPQPPTGAEPPWKETVDLVDHLHDWKGQNGGKDKWVRVPLDAPEVAFHAMIPEERDRRTEGWQPLDCVWVGMEFRSEGLASPALSQMRLDFDAATYLKHLPELYGENPLSRQSLGRFLMLFESQFSRAEAEINRMPALFDPAAAPPEALPWLAGWMGMRVLETWEEERQREAITGAFGLFGRRGTISGLRQAVRWLTGVHVLIEEPLLQTGWWSLGQEGEIGPEGENSVLGFNTVLVAAEPQGAVAGTTATLDRSHLINDDEQGAPLFMDLAHHFNVLMYRGPEYSEAQQGAVIAAIEQEKPSHTTYELCVIEPRMRIGFQARLGIDTIIAGAPKPGPALGSADGTDSGGFILGGQPPGKLGTSSQVGGSLRLGT